MPEDIIQIARKPDGSLYLNQGNQYIYWNIDLGNSVIIDGNFSSHELMKIAEYIGQWYPEG